MKANISKDSIENKKIQTEGNNLLRGVIDDIHKNSSLYLYIRNQEDQDDKGVDFEIEIQDKQTTVHMFKIQNKGCGKSMQVLKGTTEKGKISYAIKIKHVRYYRYEIPTPLIFTVCDVVNKKVYWHAIQLDDNIDERINAATANQQYVQIYIDPKNVFTNSTIDQFMRDMHMSFIEQSSRFRYHANHPLIQIADGIDINRKQHILDQLYQYLSWSHGSLNYFPVSLLTRRYPFKVEKTFFPFYSKFQLTTDNEKIMEMLANVQVLDHKEIKAEPSYFDGVDDYMEKLMFIFTKLSENLIFDISGKTFSKSHHIHLRSDSQLVDAEDHFKHFKFREAIEFPTDDQQTLEDELSEAFLQYRFRNYITAAKRFKQIAIKAKSSKNSVVHTICQYNLRTLGNHIRNTYWGTSLPTDLVDELTKINLDQTISLYKTDNAPDVYLFIRDTTFFHQSNHSITKILRDIRTAYHQSLLGHSGSNSFVWNLFNDFGDFIQFIEKNHIIYETFQEFDSIVDQFTEGIFALYALPETYETRLKGFDDWVLYCLLFFGKHETIAKYAKRYSVDKVDYLKGNQSDSFLNLAQNFLNGLDGLKECMDKAKDGENDDFLTLYNRYFTNLITLLALVKQDSDQINSITRQLISYLGKQDMLYQISVMKLPYFIRGNQNEFDLDTFKILFDFILENPKFQNPGIMERICEAMSHRKFKISLSPDQFSSYKSIIASKSLHDFEKRTWLIGPFHIFKNKRNLNWITKKVQQILAKKFDPDLYYSASIFDLIPFDPIGFGHFIETVRNQYKSHKHKVNWKGEQFLMYSNVDSLANLCFKENIPLSDSRLDEFRKLNTYYQWLFDMGNFDYKFFVVDWILNYQTKFYNKRFRDFPQIKSAVVDYLSVNDYPLLKDKFFDLYYKDHSDDGEIL